MLSKKIEFNFSKFLKKKRKEETRHKEDIRRRAVYDVDLQTKISGFAIGFFINLALGALILSIGFLI